jgi:hypothetical protein
MKALCASLQVVCAIQPNKAPLFFEMPKANVGLSARG